MKDAPLELDGLVRERVVWESTDDVEYPYRAAIGDKVLTLRLNDFPDEPLFSLLVDGAHVADFDDWPPHWIR